MMGTEMEIPRKKEIQRYERAKTNRKRQRKGRGKDAQRTEVQREIDAG